MAPKSKKYHTIAFYKCKLKVGKKKKLVLWTQKPKNLCEVGHIQNKSNLNILFDNYFFSEYVVCNINFDLFFKRKAN